MPRIFPARPAQIVTRTFTASGSIVIPAGVTKLDLLRGNGARGSDGYDYYVQRYRRVVKTYQSSRVDGQIYSGTAGTDYGNGPVPSNYCDSMIPTPNNPSYSYLQQCYEFSDASYYDSVPTRTGASATAFDKTFPGSRGSTTPAITSFSDVPVKPGTHDITVPSGGSVTVIYTQT